MSAGAQCDKRKYRCGVGIVLSNQEGKVLLARRAEVTDQWQFPQGGIEEGESETEAMYRELYEEIGLAKHDVKVLGCTRSPVMYDIPENSFINMTEEFRSQYRGQALTFFLLRLVSADTRIDVARVANPEFDHWTWVDYWFPVTKVVDFKKEIYRLALCELETHLKRGDD